MSSFSIPSNGVIGALISVKLLRGFLFFFDAFWEFIVGNSVVDDEVVGGLSLSSGFGVVGGDSESGRFRSAARSRMVVTCSAWVYPSVGVTLTLS